MKSFKINAIKVKSNVFGEYYHHIGINKEYAYMWGQNPDDVIEIEMTISEDQSEPNWEIQEYWGWLPVNSDKFEMIYPNYKLFHCCFPYGVKAYEEIGKGKSYRLKIV